jgi:hypothetical protein
MTDEIYECHGCGGDVSIVEAVWLPEPVRRGDTQILAYGYCCKECYEQQKKALASASVKGKDAGGGKG